MMRRETSHFNGKSDGLTGRRRRRRSSYGDVDSTPEIFPARTFSHLKPRAKAIQLTPLYIASVTIIIIAFTRAQVPAGHT